MCSRLEARGSSKNPLHHRLDGLDGAHVFQPRLVRGRGGGRGVRVRDGERAHGREQQERGEGEEVEEELHLFFHVVAAAAEFWDGGGACAGE